MLPCAPATVVAVVRTVTAVEHATVRILLAESVVRFDFFESVLRHAILELDVVEILRFGIRCACGTHQREGRPCTGGESLECGTSFHERPHQYFVPSIINFLP